jgi:hypothetical protein
MIGHPDLIDFASWLTDAKHQKLIPGLMRGQGYQKLINPARKDTDGRWKVQGGRQVVVYRHRDVKPEEAIPQAEKL